MVLCFRTNDVLLRNNNALFRAKAFAAEVRCRETQRVVGSSEVGGARKKTSIRMSFLVIFPLASYEFRLFRKL